jgi:alpha-glucosidase
LPWSSTGDSLGFGPHGSWLPMPDWFADYSVKAQEDSLDSTLTLYRTALRLRRELRAVSSTLTWLDPEHPQILHFRRSGGWECVVNFGPDSRPLPPGRILLTSEPLDERAAELPADTAVWLLHPPD